MKKLNLIYAFLPLLAFTSCKKDNSAKPVTTPTTPIIAAVRDSVSYTIDGITYTAGASITNPSSGTEDADRKLVFYNDDSYSLIGPQDSIMYFQKTTFLSNSANINIYFVKKFFRQQTPLYFPGLNSVLTMFTTGKHALAEDFEWQNSQNGIAIDAEANNTGYSSYNAYNGYGTVAIPAGFQKNSSFNITSFVQATDNTITNSGYNLVAKFTAVVFDGNGNQKNLENGYLSLHFSPAYAINGY